MSDQLKTEDALDVLAEKLRSGDEIDFDALLSIMKFLLTAQDLSSRMDVLAEVTLKSRGGQETVEIVANLAERLGVKEMRLLEDLKDKPGIGYDVIQSLWKT